MKSICSLLCVSLFLVTFTGCNQTDSGEKSPSKMDWWNDARFGMFIHWGLYSIPAGEWGDDTHHAEWIRTTARIPLEVYDTLINSFNPVNFDADTWVKTAKDAGMKYIVITSKHHDGFCLFDSQYTDFDVMSSPFGRDILGELAQACNEQGIVLCFYHSIMDWHHPDYLPRRSWETDRSPKGADPERYFRYMKNQLKELTTNYGKTGVLWFDGEWEESWTHERGVDLYNYVDSLQPGIIINNRVDKGRSGMQGMTASDEYKGDFGTPEQEVPATGIPGVYWESCITLNNNWGYNKADNNWKSAGSVIRMLADIASKGGNLLLNIGPKADGTFPEQSVAILSEMGRWMQKNGESIYETSASPFRSLDWGRCTVRKEKRTTTLYLHVFNWPDDGRLVVPGLHNSIKDAYLLQSGEKIKYSRTESDLLLEVPAECPDKINTVIVLEVIGDPVIFDSPVIEPQSCDFVSETIWSVPEIPGESVVKFTLDGSEPSDNSTTYTAPVEIYDNTIVRAVLYYKGKRVSGETVRQYNKVLPAKARDVQISGAGLQYRYFEMECDSIPGFNSLSPVKTGIVNNVTVIETARAENFVLDLYGYINIPEDGMYSFSVASDDGSIVFINGEKVIDNDGLHGLTEKKGNVALGKGYHSVEVQYLQKGGDKTLVFAIEGSGKKYDPETLLFH